MSVLSTVLFRLIPPSFRVNYCPRTWQQFANDLMAGTQIQMLLDTGTAFYNYGNVTPLPENRIYPWIHSGNGRLWIFRNSLWTSPRTPTETSFRWMWKPSSGTLESDAWALDGGDGTDPSTNPPTDTTGAMWEVDHTMDGVFPLGVGTIPGTTTTIAVAATGGASEHTNTLAEMVEHDHLLAASGTGTTTLSPAESLATTGTAGSGDYKYVLSGSTDAADTGLTGKSGSTTPFSILPPYAGVWWLKCTARIHYTLPA